MSDAQTYFSSLKFIIFLLLLFVVIMAQGREIAKKKNEMVRAQLMIGSRPPRCERKWCYSSCGHCEPIQVPIGSQIHNLKTTHFYQSNLLHSRGDDITNYKPMSWKCKCGNVIFNP